MSSKAQWQSLVHGTVRGASRASGEAAIAKKKRKQIKLGEYDGTGRGGRDRQKTIDDYIDKG